MADFSNNRSLNLDMSGSMQTLGVTDKDDFYILNKPSNSNNIEIYAGDNDILVWELAPGDSWQISQAVATLNNAFPKGVPLKVQGTSGDQLVGFIG